MKAAYANQVPARAGKATPGHLRLVSSNDTSQAQGPEAKKVSEVVQELLRAWDHHAEARLDSIQNVEAVSYNHIIPKQLFSVSVQYKYVGRMKPRQFALDE